MIKNDVKKEKTIAFFDLIVPYSVPRNLKNPLFYRQICCLYAFIVHIHANLYI